MTLLPITNLATYAKAIGKGYVYMATDPTTATSWSLVGITEGDIVVDEKMTFNDYKLPEWTGDAVHARDLVGKDIHITVPLVWGAAALYASMQPDGNAGGGRSKPQAVTTKTVLIVSMNEVGAGLSNGAAGTTWTPAAPVTAIWLHKATFEPGQYHFKHADGGKVIRPIGIKAMFDATKPEGQMLYTLGDPYTAGITTYRV